MASAVIVHAIETLGVFLVKTIVEHLPEIIEFAKKNGLLSKEMWESIWNSAKPKLKKAADFLSVVIQEIWKSARNFWKFLHALLKAKCLQVAKWLLPKYFSSHKKEHHSIPDTSSENGIYAIRDEDGPGLVWSTNNQDEALLSRRIETTDDSDYGAWLMEKHMNTPPEGTASGGGKLSSKKALIIGISVALCTGLVLLVIGICIGLYVHFTKSQTVWKPPKSSARSRSRPTETRAAPYSEDWVEI